MPPAPPKELLPLDTALARQVIAGAAERLTQTYTDADRGRLYFQPMERLVVSRRVGAGSAAWTAVDTILTNLEEAVMPGLFASSAQISDDRADLYEGLSGTAEALSGVLFSYYQIELDGRESRECATQAALHLIARLPEFRARARWNIFASLKDPALWDSFVLRNEKRREELGRLDLIPQIDRAIAVRNPDLYAEFLREQGFEYALNYQRRLVKRAYPGWRALLLHDLVHALAVGGEISGSGVMAPPVPFLPRVIAEHAATLFQTDLHPETIIGDANFLEHPHRGITTGQTGRIGVGCVIYPCTLGGVTDKVKPRHPLIEDYVLIGTDVGIYGPVTVGAGSVIGPNTEINGLVEIGAQVKIRAAVVARTVISETGKPGKIIFGEGTTIGEECLIINQRPEDLLIPPGSALPAHSYVVNDGHGRPAILT